MAIFVFPAQDPLVDAYLENPHWPRSSLSEIHTTTLIFPKAHTSLGRSSFQFPAVSDWNELQKSLKLDSFISLLCCDHVVLLSCCVAAVLCCCLRSLFMQCCGQGWVVFRFLYRHSVSVPFRGTQKCTQGALFKKKIKYTFF